MKKDIDIDDVVEDLLKKHTGGQKFFTALDRRVKRKNFFLRLYDKMSSDATDNHFIDGDETLVVSGKFGEAFAAWAGDWYGQILLVPGGLRGKRELNLSAYRHRIEGTRFVFLDDSYYSGKTARAIINEIARLGGMVVRVYVIYDGGKQAYPLVKSLYRYYDKKVKQ